MAKVIFKDKEDLQLAKDKAGDVVSYRQMRDGRKIAAKWPSNRKSHKKKNKE